MAGKKENIIQEKSYAFALNVIRFVRKFPRTNEGFVIGQQLLKSATSIGANVEEAIGGFSKSDFTHKMNIALKEAREANYWLRLIRDSGLAKYSVEILITESEEIRKILTAIVKSAQKVHL
ncbi:MAG: four helix bundle protein [bacterium]